MKPQTLSACLVTALLPLAGAKCNSFDFTDSNSGHDGYTETYSGAFALSNIVNCTAELAASDSGRNNNQTCAVHHYAAGLIMHPEVRQITTDEVSAARIYSLVRKVASTTAVAATNFNTTIVANYTAVEVGIPVNVTGYLVFTPVLRCFDGTLSGCAEESDSNAQFEGKNVTACGLVWLNGDQAALEASRQQYYGVENVVQTDRVNDQQEPQPRYEDVAEQQTFSDDESSGAVRNLGVGWWASVAAALAVGAMLH